VDVYVDADHAGCLRTKESTSGGCVMVGTHLLKFWSSIQPVITLSSGEAEFYGVVRGGAVGLGFLSLLAGLGIIMVLRLWTDSVAGQGMCALQGLGKVRHLDVQGLWVQQRIRNGDFSLTVTQELRALVGLKRTELLGIFIPGVCRQRCRMRFLSYV